MISLKVNVWSLTNHLSLLVVFATLQVRPHLLSLLRHSEAGAPIQNRQSITSRRFAHAITRHGPWERFLVGTGTAASNRNHKFRLHVKMTSSMSHVLQPCSTLTCNVRRRHTVSAHVIVYVSTLKSKQQRRPCCPNPQLCHNILETPPSKQPQYHVKKTRSNKYQQLRRSLSENLTSSVSTLFARINTI
jgi:hypothetical protein